METKPNALGQPPAAAGTSGTALHREEKWKREERESQPEQGHGSPGRVSDGGEAADQQPQRRRTGTSAPRSSLREEDDRNKNSPLEKKQVMVLHLLKSYRGQCGAASKPTSREMLPVDTRSTSTGSGPN
jgi:hypothetical protein